MCPRGMSGLKNKLFQRKKTFENKKIEVPKTGDESKIKLFAGAIILSLLGITYIVIRNHNKNKQEQFNLREVNIKIQN